jgi:hypothetical protein
MDVHTFCPVTDQASPGPSVRTGQAGQVRAGARLAEQLTPDLLAGPQRPQPAGLLLVRAEREDGRGGHAEPDTDPLRLVVRRTGRGELGLDHRLQRPGQALPAQAGRVVHSGQARVEPGPEELQPRHAGRVMAGQELADLLAQPARAGRPGAAHVAAGQHNGPPAT